MIVAPQVAIFVPRAQNHALPKSAYVPANSSVDYDDAGCVQGSTTGTIGGGRETQVRFVPVSIREMLLKQVNQTSGHSTLYSSVRALGKRTKVDTGEYLDKYYSKYDPVASEFIAHFERPAKCIGVVVLIEDEIIAIDKFPSFTYTAQVWDLLIRDCYGSLAIESMNRNTVHADEYGQVFVELDPEEGENHVGFLKRVLGEMKQRKSERILARIREIGLIDFDTERDINSDERYYESNVLKSVGYIGQAISTGDYNHLVSLIKKDKFDPKSVRAAFEATEVYRVMAEKQREFAL